jgi:hypothetical protein
VQTLPSATADCVLCMVLGQCKCNFKFVILKAVKAINLKWCLQRPENITYLSLSLSVVVIKYGKFYIKSVSLRNLKVRCIPALIAIIIVETLKGTFTRPIMRSGYAIIWVN